MVKKALSEEANICRKRSNKKLKRRIKSITKINKINKNKNKQKKNKKISLFFGRLDKTTKLYKNTNMKIETHKLKLKKKTELNIVHTHKDKERNKIIVTAMLQNTIWGVLRIEITEEEAHEIATELGYCIN